jgi:S-adenosyl-L-methionine hydrolase (adenosine-forming)
VVVIDRFGNLLTNIPTARLPLPPRSVEVAGRVVPAASWVHSYVAAPPGELVALASSGGCVEVAVVNGSAAARLGVGVGAAVRVEG